ncbi:hypothetical protein DI005_09905 [Prauserella sp. PE36]|uniref:Asp23/Gls24 family envelope stress response protein n=1 Tax=Prauserella endophytica TaxID=1592324 RepID=A0ABY2SC31_9PSEU|nr:MULTISPECIES: hypothetical protein [Prauserella]RBM21573.1 hypothetical protein DI005_09905 [Prauserella sp. PE36]TKG72914.1 hypothetical protein FCN18_06770 [Prauserella endophytica]
MSATERLADAIARDLSAHPSVVRLDGGVRGTLATHLPGRKVVGVRVTGEGEPVDLGVVLRLDDSLPGVLDDLRARVRAIAGTVPVNVEVADIVHVREDTPEQRRAR